MRDINRIDKYCDELRELWKQVPDWRFGQLMTNLLGSYYQGTGQDPFFVEDEEMFNYMKGCFSDEEA